jgi:hypothetical protein
MLTAVPLPDGPLAVLWQSTLIDIEPGTRYGYKNDAAAINTTLAVVNNTGSDLSFPLLLASTDPEERDPSHMSVRVGGERPSLTDTTIDAEWDQFAAAVRANAQAQGYTVERVNHFLSKLKGELKRARKSEVVTLKAGEERFIRSYQRKVLPARDAGLFEFRGIFPLPQFVLPVGGSISVIVALPRSTNRFGVDLVDWTRNYGPQAFGKDPGLPQVAGRFMVSWFWRNDPELYVTYRYA